MRTALHEDGIPAITEPAFGADWSDWSAVPTEHHPEEFPTLPDDASVVGAEREAVVSPERGGSPAERDGEARAYPLRILDHHEVVVALDVWRVARDPPRDASAPPPPGSVTVSGRDAARDYGDSKYGYEGETQVVGYDSATEYPLVVVHEGEAVAYPFDAVRAAGVVNDRVGSLPVVVATTPDGSLTAYERAVDGETLRFSVDDDRYLRAGGSR